MRARTRFAAVTFIAMAAARTLCAETETVNFESFNIRTATVRSGSATFTGGIVSANDFFWIGLQGKTYVSAWDCVSFGCSTQLKVKFDSPVDNLRFTLARSWDGSEGHWVTMVDDRGRLVSMPPSTFIHPQPNPAVITWPGNGVSELTIYDGSVYPYRTVNTWKFGIDNLTFDSPPKYGIVARLGDDPDEPNPPAPVRVTGTTTVKIPLGRTASVRLKVQGADGIWRDVPSSFALERGTVQDSPSRPEETLFPIDPVFLYNTRPNPSTRLIQSLHLGSAPLNIIPTNTSLPKVRVTIQSVEPGQLGASSPTNITTWDGHFWAQGSIRGIPPQYIKAIADHETGGRYNGRAFRYEPGADRRYVAPHVDEREKEFWLRIEKYYPFADYKLATPNLTVGQWLCPILSNSDCGFTINGVSQVDDLLAPTTYNYLRQGVLAHIPGAPHVYEYITIREICDGNLRQGWVRPDPAEPDKAIDCPVFNTVAPPPSPARRRAAPPRPGFDVVANPPEASSYGMMQTTWYSIIDDQIWPGVSPVVGGELRHNPSLLFDEPANIARGSASIIIGPNELRHVFKRANGVTSTTNPNYNAPADFARQMRNALIRYNGGGDSAIDYADNRVGPLVPTYLAIFRPGVGILGEECDDPPASSDDGMGASIVPGGTATIAAGIRAIRYQWYEGMIDDTSRPVADSDRASIDVAPTATTSYWVIASNTCGSARQQVTVIVAPDCQPPQFLSTNDDQSVAAGATVQLSALVTGGTAYQWYQVPMGGEPAPIPGATALTVSVTPQITTTYSLVATNDCSSLTSRPIRIAVASCPDLPTISTHPSDETVDSGEQPRLLQVGVAGAGPFTYQWFQDGAPIAGATQPTYQPLATTTSVVVSRVFEVRVTNGCGTVSASARITVVPPAPPTDLTATAGPTEVDPGLSASIVAHYQGPTIPMRYQLWQLINGQAGTGIQEKPALPANPALPPAHPDQPFRTIDFTVTPLDDTTYFVRAILSETPLSQVDSNQVTIRVRCIPPYMTVSADPVSRVIDRNGSALLSALGTGKGLGITWYRGQWPDESNLAGHQRTLSVHAGAAIQSFWALGVDSCGHTIHSPAQTIYTCLPIIHTQPVEDLVIPANGSGTLHVVAESSNATPLRYQWYRGYTYTSPVANSNSPDWTVTAADAGPYWVGVYGACDPANPNLLAEVRSATAMVRTCVPPVLSGVTPSQEVERNTVFTLSLVPTGTELTTQWYRGVKGDTSTPIDTQGNTFYTFTVTEDSTFWARVFSMGVCQAETETISITVCNKPVITQPARATDAEVMPSGTTTLSVAAVGTNVTYQWYQGPLGNRSTPLGSTATITTPPLTANTSFWVEIASRSCKVTSAVSVSICFGMSATWSSVPPPLHELEPFILQLNVTSPGSYHVYWYQGTSGNVAGSTLIAGPTTAPNRLISPTTTATYWARVKRIDSACYADTSTITLQVCLPAITQQPLGTMINRGTSAPLSVTATGGPLTYQWYRGEAGNTANPVAGATSASTSVSPTSTATYWVRVTAGCTSIDSEVVTVTVCEPAVITSQPTGASIQRGQSTGLAVFATGTDVSYQWYAGDPGFTTSPAGSGEAITVSPNDTTTYWVRATAACTPPADSVAAVVRVCTTPNITAQPSSRSIFSGTSTTLTVTATSGTSEPLHYQWYRGDPSSFTAVGTDSPSYTTPPLTILTQYRVRITSATCNVTSADATVSICPLPTTTAGAPDQVSSVGQTVRLQLPPPPSGSQHRWFRGVSGDTSQQLTGWQVANYMDVSPLTTTQYWAQIQTGTCVSNTTTSRVQVCIPTITQQPGSIMINPGASTTLTVAADTPGLTYQWYIGDSGNTASPIGGATGASVIVSPAVTTSYWVRVNGSCSRFTDSLTAIVTICQPPLITVQPSDASITRGAGVTLSVGAIGSDLTYQWYQGAAGNTSTPFGNNASLSIAPQVPTDYWVRVSGSCGAADSRTAHVSVCITPNINAQPQSVSIFSGASTTLTVAASSGTGEPMHYLWHRGSTPVGTDSPSLVTGPLTVGGDYSVRITAGICSVTSATATVTICSLPQSIAGAPGHSTTSGQTVRLQLGNMANTTYRWFRGASGDTSQALTSWQVANYIDVSPLTTTQYWAQVQKGACVSNTTATTVNVCVPTITQQPAGITIVNGASTPLTVQSSLPASTYQWYRGVTGDVSALIGGATAATVIVTPTVTTSYWVRVSGTCGQSVDSDTVTVTVCELPVLVTQLQNSSAFPPGYLNSLSINASGTNLSYQWYRTSGDTSSPLAGAIESTYSATPFQTERLWVRVTGMCGSVDSAAAFMSVIPQITQSPASMNVTSGSTARLSLSVGGTFLSYVWRSSGGQIVEGAPNAPVLIIPSVTAAKNYNCSVTSGIGVATSGTAQIGLCNTPRVTGVTMVVTSPGCKFFNVAHTGSAATYTWYKGVRGDAIPANVVGTNRTFSTCTAGEYWVRVSGTDPVNGACKSDSLSQVVP